MIKVFTLPDLGEGLTESEIVTWLVASGDMVTLNQPLADVETAKATVELPSPFAGIVRQLHHEPGDVVQVGEPIVSFEVVDVGVDVGEADAAAADAGATDAAAVAAATDPVTDPVPNPLPVPEPETEPRPRPERVAAPDAQVVAEPAVATDGEAEPELERDLDSSPEREPVLVGYGAEAERGGRPARRPRKPIATVPPASVTETEPSARGGETTTRGAETATETRTPVTGVRRRTAAAMVQSAFTAPQASESITIDVTPTLELLESLGPVNNGRSIGILAAASKALCLAVRRSPALNASWDDAAGEIVEFHAVNLGIAVATPRGLLVPHIKRADAMSLTELAGAITALAEEARASTTQPSSLIGGTITITNIGVFGVDAGTPILNPGEAAILAMGAVRRAPWEYGGEIALRSVMTLTLTFDHRLVDGEQASHFLVDIGRILSNPGMTLALV